MNERLKELRKALNMTQAEFAERIGAKRNTITTYEIGRNIPSDPIVHSICVAFNVNEAWLRTGEGEMFLAPSEFSLDEYAKANKLTDLEYELLRGLLGLDPKTRKAVCDVFFSAMNRIPDSPAELERMCPPVDENVG